MSRGVLPCPGCSGGAVIWGHHIPLLSTPAPGTSVLWCTAWIPPWGHVCLLEDSATTPLSHGAQPRLPGVPGGAACVPATSTGVLPCCPSVCPRWEVSILLLAFPRTCEACWGPAHGQDGLGQALPRDQQPACPQGLVLVFLCPRKGPISPDTPCPAGTLDMQGTQGSQRIVLLLLCSEKSRRQEVLLLHLHFTLPRAGLLISF